MLKFLQLNTESYAIDMEDALAGLMPSPPIGIYASHKVEPVLVPGVAYHGYNPKTGKRYEITSINDIISSVFNSKEDLVVGTWYANHKEHNLSEAPIIPYWGTKFMIAFIEDAINERSMYLNRSNKLDALLNQVKGADDKNIKGDVTRLDKLSSIIDNALDGILRQILEFIGEDRWNIYYVSFQYNKMTITKDIDYRIKEWEELQLVINNPLVKNLINDVKNSD